MVLVFILTALVFPFGANAYLDPGTGSFVIQIIIASVATAAFNVKIFWRKIKKILLFFSGRNNGKHE
ncbi:MAG: hypothetical protein HYT36_02015 [Candidatus Staskawiczbacteria bacterium]|nr:hypothetical protein [Candidatus Staskawiczbacteria bacterium]